MRSREMRMLDYEKLEAAGVAWWAYWPIEHAEFICAAMTLAFVTIHLDKGLELRTPVVRGMFIVFTVAYALAGAFIFLVLLLAQEPVYFGWVVGGLGMYGVLLFVGLSEMMQLGLGQFLTRKRGENWTKEIDYLYLAFGVAGVFFALNKTETLVGRFTKVDLIAPMLITTALVLRALKTRAEINKWNKLKKKV